MKFTCKIIPDEFSGKVALVTGAGTGNGEAYTQVETVLV